MTSKTPVLIIGAGPTGLMMACELARHGISFRIIDKKPEPTAYSNATWIQTRTIELLDHIGLIDRFLRNSHSCHAINLYANGEIALQIPLNQIDSTYPFILMLPQHETEKLLNQHLEELHYHVERSAELVKVTQQENLVISTIQHTDGSTEEIASDWLIACDGANSKVRELCQIVFPGQDLPEQFMVADAEMGSCLPSNEIHLFFDAGTIFPEKGTILAAFPWGSKQYRITANLYQEHSRQTFTTHEVKDAVHERTYGNYTAESVAWISPFWIHSKVVENMRHGAIFLAGDAAHIHSPLGGQGMNAGLQDAYNLAWKIALVIKNKAKSTLLDSYHLERHPIVSDIVSQTETLTKMALFDPAFIGKLTNFGTHIARQKPLAKNIGMQLTQLSIQYQNSPIINYTTSINTQSPQQGERVPDVTINASSRLFDYLHNTLHNVLLFTGTTDGNNQKLLTLQTWLNEHFADLVKTHLIAKNKVNNKDDIFDEHSAIHQAYHISKPTIYIMRPDNYIGYCSQELDSAPIEKFLRQY